MPEKKNHAELPFDMLIKTLMGFVVFFLLFVIFRLLFVYFEGGEMSAALGSAAITIGVLLGTDA